MGFELWNNLMVGWFICWTPQTARQCCHPFSKTHQPRHPILWGFALYDEQNSVTLSDRHSTGQSPPSSLLSSKPVLLAKQNRIQFVPLWERTIKSPSHIHMAELSDNSTLFKGAWAKSHKSGVSAVKLVHQTWKTVKRDIGEHVEVFGREDSGEGRLWPLFC